MATKETDTIVALATPFGISSIAVIRLSGKEAKNIVKKFVKKRQLEHQKVQLVSLQDPTSKKMIDEACLIYFKAPNSYTGEDSVEIQSHGSPVVIKQLLASLCRNGARLAEKGEFSKRAFLNGKIDLTKAEATIDLIHAKSTVGAEISLSHLQGLLYKRISKSRAELMSLLEHIEASIDFPDEVDSIDPLYLRQNIENILDYLNKVIEAQDYGKRLSSGVKCLIVGYPNVGKSSLLNQVLGEDRAIVTSLPGTTRDFIEAQVELGGFIFEFIDTAGIRKTADEIETLGINRIKGLLENADAILWVIDGTRALNSEEISLYKSFPENKSLYILINKIDEKQSLNKKDPLLTTGKLHHISAKTGDGLATLKTALREEFTYNKKDLDLDLICNIRQLNCIQKAKENLENLKRNLSADFEDDLLAIDIKDAILQLGEITGDDVTEEVLDGVFQRFCVGK